ncbi:hypothetical protein HMPREF3190_00594 [Umbribacter vaginalis]|nr:hypothetical protein HMPREF3190_00594 [Coriobacteriales bacterium DNF00809]
MHACEQSYPYSFNRPPLCPRIFSGHVSWCCTQKSPRCAGSPN